MALHIILGQIFAVAKKRADKVRVYYINVHICFAQDFGANCSQKTGRYSGGYTTYIYMYGLAHDFGAIVPKKRADIVGVYYIYVHVWHCT